MTRAALVALVVLFWLVQGTTHAWVWATLMLTAIVRDARHTSS